MHFITVTKVRLFSCEISLRQNRHQSLPAVLRQLLYRWISIPVWKHLLEIWIFESLQRQLVMSQMNQRMDLGLRNSKVANTVTSAPTLQWPKPAWKIRQEQAMLNPNCLAQLCLSSSENWNTSYLEQQKARQNMRMKELTTALDDLHSLLVSKKTKFLSGPNGLQARHAHAMESHLRLFIKSSYSWAKAAKQAAEAYGFTANWEGQQLQGWNRQWVKDRALSILLQSRHAKIESLLDDPAIAAELWLYLWSNKWAINPKKLTQFTKNKLLPMAAEQYLKQVVCTEMPAGLKKYMEVELFSRIHLCVGQGISLSTACQWLHHEGFRYISYWKELYFDGHDQPDVLKYHNKHFLPTMAALQHRLIRYVVGNVDTVLEDLQRNFVEHILVLVAYNEMTSQANDSHDKSWVLGDEHQLWKKGAGCGLHLSDGICSIVGWLRDGSQTLEYGKNYEMMEFGVRDSSPASHTACRPAHKGRILERITCRDTFNSIALGAPYFDWYILFFT